MSGETNADVSVQGTGWFGEYENDVNHMPWPSQSQDLKPTPMADVGPMCLHHHHHQK